MRDDSDKIRKRLSRYQRADSPPPLVLQERDRQILAAVGQHRFLSREQIERLFFGTTTRANFRLQKLYQHKFLNRLHLPTVRGSSQAIYCLDRNGVEVAAEALGVPPATIPWKYKNRDVGALFLKHLLGVNDVRIAFEVAARENSGHELLLWLPEQDAKNGYGWHSGSKVLAPDAYGRYGFGDRVISFFVELDRATMTNKRWQEKVDRYLEYSASGRYEERFGMKLFRVLVVTTTPQRRSNLLSVTAERTDKMFWFTTLESIRDRGVLGAGWSRSGSIGLQLLLG
jgi:hypothetical protein